MSSLRLNARVERFRETLGYSSDLIVRELRLPGDQPAALLFVEGMASTQSIHQISRRIPRSSISWGGMRVRLCLNALFVWRSFLYCAMIWIEGRGTYDRNCDG